MAVSNIQEIVLYTCDFKNPVECHDAIAWFDHSGVEYLKLHYSDPAQESAVLDALNTWWTGKEVSYWPFVVYKVADVGADFVEGLDNIKTAIPALLSNEE